MVSWPIPLIYPLFVNRFGCSFRFCQLEFYQEVKFDVFMAHSRVFREGDDKISFVLDIFLRSSRFCHKEFDKEANSNSFHFTFPCFQGEGVISINLDVLYSFVTQNLIRKAFLMVSFCIPVILRDSRQLSSCGPCGLCYIESIKPTKSF